MLNDTELRVKGILKKVLGNDELIDKLDAEQNLSDLGITSVNFIKIIVLVEDEFDIEFDDEDLKFENFNTIANVSAYIEDKIS